jgi:hypothetical protein
VHQRVIDDVENTFRELKLELIRHHFWHVDIDQRAKDHALRKGAAQLLESIPRRISTSVGKASPFRDGQQTPFTGNVLFYAQHATASCCRTCIEYWHGIESGRELTAGEQDYLAGLVRLYVVERLPDLPDGPTYVPRRRHSDSDEPC